MPRFILSIEEHEPVYGEMEFTQAPRYYRVLHDFELRTGIRNCAPCPEVITLGLANNYKFSYKYSLNIQWQWFSFSLFATSAYNKAISLLTKEEFDFLVSRWSALYAGDIAFTNGSGTDKYRNYILDTNQGKPDFAYDKIRACGGAYLTGEDWINGQGEAVLRVDTFDGNGNPPDISTINLYNDSRIFFADIIGDKGNVYRFPHLEGTGSPTPLVNHDVPVPIISAEPVFYPMRLLEKLPLGSVKKLPYTF